MIKVISTILREAKDSTFFTCLSQTLYPRICLHFRFHFLFFAFTGAITGTYVQQDIICPGFIGHMAITCTILSMRGAANLVEPRDLTNHVTMKTFGRDSTGTEREWCRVIGQVISSPVFTDLLVTTCIVLNYSNVVNCSTALEEVCSVESTQ